MELDQFGTQTFDFELRYASRWRHTDQTWRIPKQAHVFAANADEATAKVRAIAGELSSNAVWDVEVLGVREVRR